MMDSSYKVGWFGRLMKEIQLHLSQHERHNSYLPKVCLYSVLHVRLLSSVLLVVRLVEVCLPHDSAVLNLIHRL